MAIGGRTRSTRGMVILLVVASLVTITIDYREGSGGPLAKVSDALQAVVTPMQRGVSTVFHPVAAFFGALAHLGSNEAKIKSLQHQVQAYQRESRQYGIALRQLNELQQQLDIAKSYEFQTTGADVIGSAISNFEWSVDIDKGLGDGIRKEMPVMSAQGLVGKVIDVWPGGSKVLLIADPDSSVAARLVGSQQTGMLTGQGHSDLQMSLIDQSTQVATGEGVMTSAYNGGLFPAGIPIGSVADVTVDAATGEKQISVAPFVDFSKLDVVLVITSFNGG
ncbi:MAG: rod shape-determining protein MreC [Actinomycetota bacterium]